MSEHVESESRFNATTDATNLSADTPLTVEELEAELNEADAKIESLQKDLLYLQADFQNYRRRKEDEAIAQQKYVAANLLKELLPILDNFERALQAAEQTQNFDKLIGGVQGTLKQWNACLERTGVTPIETVGKEFNPQFHEAIGYTEASDLPPNTVAEEVQRGYMIHDRILRPALVKVSQG